jgi:hypothetical protein
MESFTIALKSWLRFPFRHPEWKNRFLIGSLLTLANYVVPLIPGLFVSGYMLRVMRQTIEGQEPTLPEWDDWGRMATDGLQVWAISLIYMLPGIAVMVGGWLLYMGLTMVFPFLLLGIEEADFAFFFPVILMGSMAVMFISMFVGMLLYVVGILPLPMVVSHFVARNDFGVAFRVREWWALIRSNPLGYLVGWVISMGLFSIFYLVIISLYYSICLLPLAILLVAPPVFYVGLLGFALFGQIYRESVTLVLGEDEVV